MATDDLLGNVVGSIRAVSSEQEKLTKDLEELQSELENEVHQVEQLLASKIKRLKETVLYCPPIFVKISTPRDSDLQLNLERDSERPWISSCFYTHPGGYKLCLALKSTEMSKKPWVNVIICAPDPRDHLSLPISIKECTRKPNLFLSIMAVSQEDDDHRTWPCEGKISLRLLGQRQSDPFTPKFSVEKSDTIQPDATLAMSDIRDWVPLPEEAIPFGQYYHSLYTTSDIPSTQLDIRIEAIVLSEGSKVWNCS